MATKKRSKLLKKVYSMQKFHMYRESWVTLCLRNGFASPMPLITDNVYNSGLHNWRVKYTQYTWHTSREHELWSFLSLKVTKM